MQNIETMRTHSRGCRNTQWSITPKAFAKFLSWLSPDWDEAGRKYEQIRTKMVRFFSRRGCHIPEELFDRTIDRICGKIEVEAIESIGDVLAFCYAVGRFVVLEYWREMKPAALPEDAAFPEIEDPEQSERKSEWLDRRLNTLNPRERRLIIAYYQGEGRERILKRKALAAEVGGVNALRVQLCRVRARLRGSEEAATSCVGLLEA